MAKIHRLKSIKKRSRIFDIEKKQKRNQIIIGVITISIMVLSLFGISLFSSQQTTQKFRNIKFYVNPDGSYTLKTKPKIILYTHPSLLAALNYSRLELQAVKNSSVIILSFNPNMSADSLQAVDIARLSFQQQALKPVFSAVTNPSTNYKLPIITCSNSTRESVVILFTESQKSGLRLNNSCIIVEGFGRSLLEYSELLLLGSRGVLE